MGVEKELARISARTAREVVARYESDEGQRAKIRQEWTPGQYLDDLLGRQNFPAAVPFLAHALPKREAVWWASLCARPFSGAAPFSGALAAAEKWAADPKEENRRSAMSAALEAGLVSAAGCAALAAFVSEGSLAPPEAPPVPPPETMTSQTVAGAVFLAAAAAGEQRMTEQLRACVALGLDVARGKSSWAVKR